MNKMASGQYAGQYVLVHPMNGVEPFDTFELAQDAAIQRAKDWHGPVIIYKEVAAAEPTGEVNVKVMV